MLKKILLCAVCWFLSASAMAGVAIQHWTTPSGARVYFVELHALPMLDIRVDWNAGTMFDPPGKRGVASLTHALLDLGAGGLDESAISDRLADVGASLSGGVDQDRASLRLRTLTEADKRQAALAVFESVLAAPGFDAAVFERERARSMAGLRDALTRPGVLAARAFASALYPQHPYGALTSEESLQAISRDDLVAFWKTHYSVANAVITLAGDLSRAEAEALASRLAAALPAEAGPVALPPPPHIGAGGTVRLAHPAQQAHLFIGLPAIARGDPDYFPLMVGNYTLGGGGFVSRLMREVREKRGFAYSVYSYFSPERQAGPFQIGLQTEKKQAAEALAVTRATLAEFLQTGPTPAELQAAKDNLAGGFPLRLDSNGKMLDNVAAIGFYGLPLDYLDTWQARVRAVTAEDVRRAFARHVQMDRLHTVIVGPGPADGDSADGGVAEAAAKNAP